eukprot:COSAG01_NODE_1443_length_10286_cov_7.093649_2_plen_94_part_00
MRVRVRVRGEMMGPEQSETVGKAQSVLMMINPMTSPRTRTNNHTTVGGRAVGPARRRFRRTGVPGLRCLSLSVGRGVPLCLPSHPCAAAGQWV